MKPIQYHPKDPNSCSHQVLKFLIKSTAGQPTPAHHVTHTLTPDSVEDEAKMKYYLISRSDEPTTDDNMYISTDEDTKL